LVWLLCGYQGIICLLMVSGEDYQNRRIKAFLSFFGLLYHTCQGGKGEGGFYSRDYRVAGSPSEILTFHFLLEVNSDLD
jgi:hypothetical protein